MSNILKPLNVWATAMGAGDHVTITTEVDDIQLTTLCGVSLMYDDGSIEEYEEDALGYYKSWNHVIGRDLSAFQSRTGEYILKNKRFCWDYSRVNNRSFYHPFIADEPIYRHQLY